MNVIIQSENGGAVKLRQSKDPKRSGYAVWEEIPSGTKAEVLQSGENWSRIRVGSRYGWMMSRFLVADDSDIPAEPELAEDKNGPVEPELAEDAPVTADDPYTDENGREQVALFFPAEQAAALLPLLESAVEQIVRKVGRG